MIKSVKCSYKGFILFLSIYFSFVHFSSAQKSNLTTEQINSFVKEVKQKLEKRGDHVVAIYSQKVEFEFDYFKPDEKDKAYASEVSVIENTKKDFIALKTGAAWDEVLFYDSQSSIEKNRMTNQKGSNIPFYPIDKKYSSGDIFHNDVWYRKIDLSAEAIGDIRSLETIKNFFDVKYLVSVYFHDEYYQKEKTIVLNIPSWLDLEIKEYNFEGYTIVKTETTDKKSGNKILTYKMENIMPYNRDKYSPSYAKSYPHLLVLPKKYTKAGKEHTIFATTQDLYNWYRKLVSEVNNKPEELKSTVDDLLKGTTTDIEKLSAIYYWVQDNIRYIAFEAGLMGFRPESADLVFKNRYGDCKGMANLLKQMLTIAGFDARLTWIGTDDIIYDYSTPSLGVDNHMICAVILNGEKIFLDGTESYIGIKDYAQRIQGQQVLIEDGENYILENIPAFDYTRNQTTEEIEIKMVDNSLVGSCKSIYKGEMKTNLLRYFNLSEQNKKEEILKRFLNKNDSNVKIKEVKTSDFSDRMVPLTIDYNFEITNAITNTGNETYLSIDFEKLFQNYDIDTIRTDDFEFDNKQHFISTTKFEIPAGYKVDYTPDAFTYDHKDYTFNANYKVEGNQINYTREFKIINGVIHLAELKKWNAQVKKLKKFYNDQIVLIK